MKGKAIFNIGGKNRQLTAEQAEEQELRLGKCRECKKPVTLYRKGKNGRAAHFVHESHKEAIRAGCDLADQSYGIN